jgi:hypothetical protein
MGERFPLTFLRHGSGSWLYDLLLLLLLLLLLRADLLALENTHCSVKDLSDVG